MPKNVVICCDGTANEFAKDVTNAIKLFRTLVLNTSRQIGFYHPGVGTMEPPGALTPFRGRIMRLLGKAMGGGLEDDIRDAYVFLMRTFEPGDRLFLLGFSRGAYTVRALASLLHMYGLIRPDNEPLVPYAIRMLVGIHRAHKKTLLQRLHLKQQTDIRALFKLATDFKALFCQTACRPHFIGVWETVSSVGWVGNPLTLPYSSDNPDIAIGRHAIAIDERRAFFRSNLWHPTPTGGPQDVKQVWFPGVHCDVGGGYPENESGLSKIALEWMLKEAIAAGIYTDPVKVDEVLGRSGGDYSPPDPKAKLHCSLTPSWWPAEFIPKPHYNWKKRKEEYRANLFRRRTIPPAALVHQSAFARGEKYARKIPSDAVPVS